MITQTETNEQNADVQSSINGTPPKPPAIVGAAMFLGRVSRVITDSFTAIGSSVAHIGNFSRARKIQAVPNEAESPEDAATDSEASRAVTELKAESAVEKKKASPKKPVEDTAKATPKAEEKAVEAKAETKDTEKKKEPSPEKKETASEDKKAAGEEAKETQATAE